MSKDSSIKNKELYNFGPFHLDAEERLLYRGETPIPLAGKSFDLLLALVRSAGHLQSREELIAALWPNTIVEESNLTWNVNALRKALGDDRRKPHYIETVRGHGYRFVAPVETQVAVSDTPDTQSAPAATSTSTPGPQRLKRRTLFLTSLVIFCTTAGGGVLSWQLASRPAVPGKPAPARSIAVLPFENLSPSKANTYFAGGIQDTILTKLSGIADLRVISRTSTQQYASHPQNLKEVARQLGVSSVLEGSVQKAGNQVLINVQLIDARTDNHIWAQAYTRTLNNIFDVESDVAEKVATALKAKLLPAEKARIASPPTQNPRAYDLFLKAGYYAAQVTDRNNAKNPSAIVSRAVSLYRQALRLDPGFALAWARLSYLRSYAYWYALDASKANTSAAEKAAKKALELKPGLPQAHMAMGFVYYYIHRDYAAALYQFDQAQRDLPNNADIIAAIAYIWRRQGALQKALAELNNAAILDPHNPRWPYNIGLTLMYLRHYNKAEQQFDRALAIEPYNYDASIYNTWTLLLAGHETRAHQALKNIPLGVDRQGLVPVIEFQVAWLGHQPALALKALETAPDWVQGPDMVGDIPKSLYQAEAWAYAGHEKLARRAYSQTVEELGRALKTQPDNPDLWSSMGLAEAGLQQRKEAIRSGLRATRLLPMSQDAVDGPLYAAALAKIYARTGDTEKALRLLKKLLSMPTGLVLSLPLLKADPVWKPLRKDPGFQALLGQGGTEEKHTAAAAPSTNPG